MFGKYLSLRDKLGYTLENIGSIFVLCDSDSRFFVETSASCTEQVKISFLKIESFYWKYRLKSFEYDVFDEL